MIKIYKLVHNGQIVYVGQTKQKLSKRKASGYGDTVPFFKECSIELIEETDDISREKYWIERLRNEGHPLLNKICGVTGLSVKEYWKEYQKEYQKEYLKEYRIKNKEKMKEDRKEYYEENKEKMKEYMKEYSKEYYQKNKEVINQKNKEYRRMNKEKNNSPTS